MSIWDAFVDACPDATAYHRYGWRAVIEKSFGHTTWYLAAIDGNNDWQGILPLVSMRSMLFGNFLVSVPFVNYGGVLCATATAIQALQSAAEGLRNELHAAHVELRHAGKMPVELPTRQHKVTMVLPLEADSDSQWKAFNAKLRNQIRKAEKIGLRTVISHLDLLDEFYDVFAHNMRDLGTPVYGKCFFRNVLETFPETTRIIAVRRGEKTVAAGIVNRFRDAMEIPWASSLSEFNTCCPNNMLYWEAIRFAIAQGLGRFDFGRSTPNEGTYNFKKQWGAEPTPLYWQYLLEPGAPLPELNPKNPKYDAAIRLWRKLPVSVTRFLGPHIVRNIP
jgi:FemAB-related protein (PEP-CTERM system-associated)